VFAAHMTTLEITPCHWCFKAINKPQWKVFTSTELSLKWRRHSHVVVNHAPWKSAGGILAITERWWCMVCCHSMLRVESGTWTFRAAPGLNFKF
jgi:hypothetical protein